MTDIPFAPNLPSLNGSHPGALRVVTLDTFVDTHEEYADPLIGHPDDTLLPADGTLLMYGDGGAGKTTLTIDALAHLASGTPWLGLTVPQPLRVLLIENEGPRGPFRTRLGAKRAGWEGPPFADNVNVLEEPWTRFTLNDHLCRHALAHEIDRTDADLLMVGPLASLGARGTGTPDDINEFDRLIRDLREQTERRFALWIVHHENKAGDVSGAWERYPDSLVHIQARGNGRTHIQWRKVRWSSTLHGTGMELLWREGHSFELEVKPERDRRAELLEKMSDGDWRTATTLGIEIDTRRDTVKDILSELEREHLVEHVSPMPGSKAWNSVGWRIRLSGYLGQAVQAGRSDPVSESLVPPVRPYKGQDRSGRANERGDRCTPDTGQASASDPDEQDQEFIDALEIERLEALARTYLAEEHQ